MLHSWRAKWYEADVAYRQGRLEKASRLIQRHRLLRCRPGQRLAGQVIDGLLRRAGAFRQAGDLTTAWRDLDAAWAICLDKSQLGATRNALAAETLARVEQQLMAAETRRASRLLQLLEERQLAGEQARRLRQAIEAIQQAEQRSREGRFAAAQRQLARAAELLPGAAWVAAQQQLCCEKLMQSRKLTDQLQRALMGEDWPTSLELAGQLLAIAPNCRLALDARRRARQLASSSPARRPWPEAASLADTQPWRGASRPQVASASAAATVHRASGETVVMNRTKSRFLLWVDGVGGYLVLLADAVVIGQAVPGTAVDLPVMGDLSRRHAMLRREGEDYLIEPLAEVTLRGQPVQRTELLLDGDEIELGEVVRLRFRRPHGLSSSARLELISGHRTQPSADGIILLAESCLLGPSWHNHIVCRDWSTDVVLYRRGEQLWCRGPEKLEIDGKLYDRAGPITYNSRVAGEDFSMSLEQV